MAYTALTLLGVGFPMLSVGLSQLAAGTSKPDTYADAVRQLQTVYMLGTVAFGTVPGFLAGRFGSYAPCYYILAALALTGALIQQGLLIKQEKSVSKGGEQL